MSEIKYSICVCNYNMGGTIVRAMESVLNQVDDNCEVLVIDDGSDDNSLEKLAELSERYPTFRYIPLKRDRKRLLGETRNISIREARGTYVIPQVDCDDVYDICLTDFIMVFHQLEQTIGKDIYLKGDKLNMGRKDFLLEYGPYRNTFKEDRDMWARLAEAEVFIPIFHKRIFTRLPKTKKDKIHRFLYKTWAHLLADYRSGLSFFNPFYRLFVRKTDRSMKVKMLRCFMTPFAFFIAQRMEPLPVPVDKQTGWFKEYWQRQGGSFSQLMQKHGGTADFECLSDKGKHIFQD